MEAERGSVRTRRSRAGVSRSCLLLAALVACVVGGAEATTELLWSSHGLTHFPNLTTEGSTLEYLNLGNNQIPDPDPGQLAPLSALEILRIQDNQLTQIPDFSTSPARHTVTTLWMQTNQIRDPPPSITSVLTAVQDIRLQRNKLTRFPDFRGWKDTLRVLFVGENEIRLIPESLLAPLVNLEKLHLAGLQLETFPHVPGLVKLTKLWLAGSSLQQLPPLWPSLAGHLTVRLPGAALDLCHCRNLWVKQALETMYIGFVYDDVTCGATLWSAHTLTSLNAVCHQNSGKEGVRVLETSRAPLPPAALPASLRHSILSAPFHTDCALACQNLPICVGFWLNGCGSCVLMAPSDTAPVPPPDAADSVWTYYGVTQQ